MMFHRGYEIFLNILHLPANTNLHITGGFDFDQGFSFPGRGFRSSADSDSLVRTVI